jgi:hypothetical protein
MKRNRTVLLAVAVLLAATSAHAQILDDPILFAPDVPSRPGTDDYQLPWQIHRQGSAGYGAMYELDLPGYPAIDAMHKMDAPGRWLLSFAEPTDLGGTSVFHEKRDLVLYDSGNGAVPFLCGAAVGVWLPIPLEPLLPPHSNIDSVYLDPMTGGDTGDLIVGFDRPLELPPGSGLILLPADLARFRRTGPGCGDWMYVGKEFDSTAAGDGIPASTNVVAATEYDDDLLFVVERPTILTPSTLFQNTALPWHVIRWDGSVFSRADVFAGGGSGEGLRGFTPPPGDSTSVTKAAVSSGGNPGSIVPGDGGTLTLAPSTTPGDIDLSWPASCSSGATDYEIYEGAIGNWPSHVQKLCSTGGETTATVTPGAGNRYYLVVPRTAVVEGSYGLDSDETERPPAPGPAACVPTHLVTTCS